MRKYVDQLQGGFMFTEAIPILFAVKVNGRTVSTNLPSRSIAEAQIFNLPADQRSLAEIVSVTSDGRQVLLG